MTRTIVEQRGGNLEIDTEPGEGTYVQAVLPFPRQAWFVTGPGHPWVEGGGGV